MPRPRRPLSITDSEYDLVALFRAIYRDTWKENSNYKIIKVKGIEAGGLRIFQDHVPATSHETRPL
jgi:hypothetical protein